jgi:predicted peroxiredoxin
VTVVTSPEPQTQLMAMVLTMQAAQQGAEAHILLCGAGGDLALREAPATATSGQPPLDMSPQGLMQMIREKTGATVEVCAIYLPGLGADVSVLLDGIGVAKPDEMARKLMAPEARVLSF